MTFRNEARGLRFAGTDFVYLTEGAYGIIFVDRGQRRIRKVYRVRRDSDIAHCREVFTNETGAYEIASMQPELSALIPAYFGPCGVPDVVDGAGGNVSDEFHADLAFETEFVECRFVKISEAPDSESGRIRDLFGRHGIHHVIDASVCLQEGTITKMIDFATEDVVLRW